VLSQLFKKLAQEIEARGTYNLSEARRDSLQESLLAAKWKPSEAAYIEARKRAVAIVQRIARGKTALPPHTLVVGGIITQRREVDIAGWLRKTAKLESDYTARRIDEIFRKAGSSWNEKEGRGPTPRDIAKEIFERGLAFSMDRANLIARTTSIYAANAGAVQGYADAGVEAGEWMATEDDLTCEACAEMDGEEVELGASFDIPSSTSSPFDIPHPPLHPYCRCTILPVLSPMKPVVDSTNFKTTPTTLP
jgi:SPP1 gp7 family putative phage head morphogenesis protein